MEELSETKKKKYKIIRIILQIVIIFLCVTALIYLTIKLFPIFIKVQKDVEYQNHIVEKIRSYGGWEAIIILFAQILQTVLAIIPSGPIVMISGILFPPFVAAILCVLGQTIGGICVYGLVKLLGYRFIALFVDPDKIKNSRLLENETRSEVLMFGYLLIPALPKDIVAFVAPFTKVTLKRFTILNFIARIPMTFVTVYMGSSLFDGSYILVIILACVSLFLAILCFVFNGKIVDFLETQVQKKK